MIAEIDRDEMRYRRFDPATGARGAEVHHLPVGPRFAHAMAVSPDGATLAVDRRWIAELVQRGDDGRTRLRPQRSGGVPVEIGSLDHDLVSPTCSFSEPYPFPGAGRTKSLLFILLIVQENIRHPRDSPAPCRFWPIVVR